MYIEKYLPKGGWEIVKIVSQYENERLNRIVTFPYTLRVGKMSAYWYNVELGTFTKTSWIQAIYLDEAKDEFILETENTIYTFRRVKE